MTPREVLAMAWSPSPTERRTSPLPAGWKALRAQALARDAHRCTWIEDGQQCTAEGTDADHIGDPEDHSLANLRTLCGYHHRKRTALQARAARGETPQRQRPAEPHPGLITTHSDTPLDAARKAARHRDDAPGF